MKSVVYEKYGPPEVLHLAEVEKPTPKDDEVLVKVRATTVTAGDWRMRQAEPFLVRLFNGLFRPKRINILGFELAGDVEAIGSKVTRFQIGDPVFASCGFAFGGYAEYRCIPENGHPDKQGILAIKPDNVSYEQAAAVPIGALSAQSFLRKGGLTNGQEVLIHGASGSVGTYAVQLAKHAGARVTGVCSTDNVEMVRSLGADEVVDYKQEDFTQRGQTYDLVFDAAGKLKSRDGKRVLKKGGTLVSVTGSAPMRPGDLEPLRTMLAAGELEVLIDRTYALEQIVEAHAYVQQQHKKGNVVVRVSD